MNKPACIPAFLLERYHLGEVSPEERRRVEGALAGDPALAASLAALDKADRDFWERFPRGRFSPVSSWGRVSPRRRETLPPGPRFPGRNRLGWGLCAAALVLAAALPWFILRPSAPASGVDRLKGGAGPELSLYLKGNGPGGGTKLADQTAARAGDTVQLAYRVPAGGDRYGVIFSIDGRSAVTPHYPYGPTGSTRLEGGETVFLEEAYTLDDAPAYEIFFLVMGDEPLEVPLILNAARQVASRLGRDPGKAREAGASLFPGRDLRVFTLRKE